MQQGNLLRDCFSGLSYNTLFHRGLLGGVSSPSSDNHGFTNFYEQRGTSHTLSTTSRNEAPALLTITPQSACYFYCLFKDFCSFLSTYSTLQTPSNHTTERNPSPNPGVFSEAQKRDSLWMGGKLPVTLLRNTFYFYLF